MLLKLTISNGWGIERPQQVIVKVKGCYLSEGKPSIYILDGCEAITYIYENEVVGRVIAAELNVVGNRYELCVDIINNEKLGGYELQVSHVEVVDDFPLPFST